MVRQAYKKKVTGVRKVGRPIFVFNDTLRRDKMKYPEITEHEWSQLNRNYPDLYKRTKVLYSSPDYNLDPLDPAQTLQDLNPHFGLVT